MPKTNAKVTKKQPKPKLAGVAKPKAAMKKGKKNQAPANHFFYGRFDTKKTVQNHAGNTVAKKTSMMIQEDQLPMTPQTLGVFKKSLSNKLENADCYTPAGKIIELNPDGSPVKIVSGTSKTPMSRVAKTLFFGDPTKKQATAAVSYFSNDPQMKPLAEQKQVLQLTDADKNKLIDAFGKIKDIKDKCKTQKVKVDKTLLQKTSKQNAKNGHKRNPTQAGAAVKPGENASAASATRVKILPSFQATFKWEWLHLIAHSMLGEDSQVIENLVAGTTHANTEMITYESAVKKLTASYPDGVNLRVVAKLIEGTHIATEILYIINTKDFTLTLPINAQQENQPCLSFDGFFNNILDALITATNEKDLSKIPSPKKKHPLLSFSKKDLVVEPEQATAPTNKK